MPSGISRRKDYKMKREELETTALQIVSPDLYYDLADTIESCTDNELYKIIDCNGSYKKELELSK